MTRPIASTLTVQNALQAGRLVAAQPGVTPFDPITAVGRGIFAFHERVHGGLWWLVVSAGGAAMGIGAVLLARSPVLSSAEIGEGDNTSER